MAKRKRSKKEIFEQGRRAAEQDPVVRELRARAAAIEVELAEKRRARADDSGSAT